MSRDFKMGTVNLVKMAVLFITVLSLLEFSSGIEYSDLIAMNATCFPIDTCKSGGKGPRLDDPYDWKYRNCFCDDLCADYGDCCLDANAYVVEEQLVNSENYECVSLKQFDTLYMKGKCIPKWEDKYIAEMCTSGTALEQNDPMLEMPVTSLDSFITYSNYYCAICNNDSSAMEIWKPRLECLTLKDYENKFKNLTAEYVATNLIYNTALKNWGLYIKDNEVEVFHRCYVYPSLPQTVTHMVRKCKEMIKNCPSDWTDESVRRLCQSYTAVRYSYDQAYRNIHCALCNDFSLDRTKCFNKLGRLYFPNDFNDQSFALLLDFSDSSGSNIVGSTSTCRSGEVFDPFFKKCRNVICGRNYQEYRFGRCIDTTAPTSVPASTELTTASTAVPASTELTTASTAVPASTELTTASTAVSESTELTTASTAVSASTELTTAPVTVPSISSVSNITKKLSSLHDGRDEMEKVNIVGNVSSESTSVVEPVTDLSNTVSAIETNDNVTSAVDTKPARKLPCERFLLPTEEYTMNDNGTVVVEKYKRTYQISEYEPSDGGILVCIIQTETDKFSGLMGWVTLAGLGLSCLCLVLHLIVFLIVPELRNLSGKNLASLCLVLLGAFSSFILSIFGEPGKRECFILAASMYYFFLASFCWVNVMAFDVWRTLTLATTELRVSLGGQWCKFMVYSIYGWLLPGAAVVALVIVDLVQPAIISPQYYPALGEYWCWFGHRKALLVFFAAPLMAIMIMNIILFILSARIIADTMESTAKMTTCSPHQNLFKLYMRLALLMGLTWISGIVAGYLQLEAIWYIFILLNTLQGFFIFLAFTCTRKVWRAVSCGYWRMTRHGNSWSGRSPLSSKHGLQSTNSNMSQLSHTSQSPLTHFTSKSNISAG